MSISLTLPVAGATITSGLHSANYTAIQGAVNNDLVPKPTSIASGEAPVWDGASWVRSTTTKLGLTSITDPGTGKVIGSSGGVATAVNPPGYEIAYSQITSNVNIASTTEASGTTIISPGVVVFDGTAVWVEFYTENLVSPSNAAGNRSIVSLFEGATQIARLASVTTSAAANAGTSVTGRFKFTPTAASHTYVVTAFADSTTGTPLVGAGAGGTATLPPAFVRFIKA